MDKSWKSIEAGVPEEELRFLSAQGERNDADYESSRQDGTRAVKRTFCSDFATKVLIIVLLVISIGLLGWDIMLRTRSLNATCAQISQPDRLRPNSTISKLDSTSSPPQSPLIAGNGFVSELPALRERITYSYQNYTGMLTYDKTTKKIVKTPDGPISYFGRPSEALDQIWEDLTNHEFAYLYDEEIRPADLVQPEDRIWDGHVRFEPDVFHNLHCMNAIRKHVNLVLYPDVPMSEHDQRQALWDKQNLGDSWMIDHIEHCMDRVRQSLQCHADLTPSPLHAFPGFAIALGMTGERVCRDWKPIRKFWDERYQRELEETKQREDAKKVEQEMEKGNAG